MTNAALQKIPLTVSVDQETRQLLAKYGGQRSIGILIARMVKNYDAEEAFGLQAIRHRLDRIENHILHLVERREGRKEK
jgi:hypothetical protein